MIIGNQKIGRKKSLLRNSPPGNLLRRLFSFHTSAETEGIPVGSRLLQATIQIKSGATFDNFASPRLRRLPVRFAQERRYQSSSDSLQYARPANCCLIGWYSKARR